MKRVWSALGVMLIASMLGVALGWHLCALRGLEAVRESERTVRALESRVDERGVRVRRLEAKADSLAVVAAAADSAAVVWNREAARLWLVLRDVEGRDEVVADSVLAGVLCASVGADC